VDSVEGELLTKENCGKYWSKRVVGSGRSLWSPDQTMEPEDEALHF
jgi:hypothetical protein